MLELLARRVDRIGLFRPLIDSNGTRDALVELLVDRYDLDVDLATACPMTYADAARHLESGHQDAVVTAAVEAFTALKARYDFVLVLGTDYTGRARSVDRTQRSNASSAARPGHARCCRSSRRGRPPDDVPAAVAQARAHGSPTTAAPSSARS